MSNGYEPPHIWKLIESLCCHLAADLCDCPRWHNLCKTEEGKETARSVTWNLCCFSEAKLLEAPGPDSPSVSYQGTCAISLLKPSIHKPVLRFLKGIRQRGVRKARVSKSSIKSQIWAQNRSCLLQRCVITALGLPAELCRGVHCQSFGLWSFSSLRLEANFSSVFLEID